MQPWLGIDQIIPQQDRKGLSPDHPLGTEDGVTQSQRLLLPNRDQCHHLRNLLNHVQQVLHSLLLEMALQLSRRVEVILNRTLLPSCDKDHLFDPCCNNLFHDILDGGFIHNGQ